jgi:hypothetical protein
MVYYVALPFVRVAGGLAPGEAVECPHAAAAIRRAEALAGKETNAGAVGDYDARLRFRWARSVRGKNSQYSFSLNHAHLMSERFSPARRASASA